MAKTASGRKDGCIQVAELRWEQRLIELNLNIILDNLTLFPKLCFNLIFHTSPFFPRHLNFKLKVIDEKKENLSSWPGPNPLPYSSSAAKCSAPVATGIHISHGPIFHVVLFLEEATEAASALSSPKNSFVEVLLQTFVETRLVRFWGKYQVQLRKVADIRWVSERAKPEL